MSKLTLYVPGDIYPYTRTTMRQKFVDEAYAKYTASQCAIRQIVREMMADNDLSPMPDGTPLRLGIIFTVKRRLHKRDLSNMVKAVEDALQGVLFGNDAWIDAIYAERAIGPADACLIMLETKTGDRPIPLDAWAEKLRRAAEDHGMFVRQDGAESDA